MQKTAPLLAEKLLEVDVIVSAEAKGISIAHEVATRLGMTRYYGACKSLKTYMDEPLVQKVQSITTEEE